MNASIEEGTGGSTPVHSTSALSWVRRLVYALTPVAVWQLYARSVEWSDSGVRLLMTAAVAGLVVARLYPLWDGPALGRLRHWVEHRFPAPLLPLVLEGGFALGLVTIWLPGLRGHAVVPVLGVGLVIGYPIALLVAIHRRAGRVEGRVRHLAHIVTLSSLLAEQGFIWVNYAVCAEMAVDQSGLWPFFMTFLFTAVLLPFYYGLVGYRVAATGEASTFWRDWLTMAVVMSLVVGFGL